MNTDNLHSIAGAVNPPSLDDLDNWLEQHGKAGRINPTTARLMAGAVKRLTSVLQPDEPRDVRSVLAQLDELADRWLRLNSGFDSGTARTYVSRASGALRAYVRFIENPAQFRWDIKSRITAGEPKTRKRAPASEAATSEQQNPREQALEEQDADAGNASALREYKLQGGRLFLYELPEELTVRDVRRIAYHLLTMADDFDPERGSSPFDAGAPGSAPAITP